MLKRIFDFTLALSGIVLSFPLWTLISLAIYLEDGLPIFYLQERIGKEARIFRAVKFRSMIKDAEKDSGPVQAKEEDPRVTKTGRMLRATAMDELPQLINIIKGEMSFVGPRALRPQEKEVQDSSIKSVFDYPGFSERNKVRPGLTGIAQIVAKRDIDRQNKFKYDLYYIKNQSFLLDLYLIIVSFLITFKGRWESRIEKFSFLAKYFKNI
ncbi:MAG: sugar transferase [Candidatus Omnitrophica bacterium]|nr:sugar transferase [Candidatus Omnitrophota bacterium]MDD5238655.1 sugar transferase [Candidatus Omnitrophota bacterium]